jgi:hypothetical protein
VVVLEAALIHHVHKPAATHKQQHVLACTIWQSRGGRPSNNSGLPCS